MDNTEVTAASGNSTKSGVIVWTPAMTNTMLGFLANLVAKGKRTSSGFREAHHRQCVAALNEQFKLAVTAEQVRNHLKKWRKIWGRVVILKNLSGALWDKDTCTIRLAEEHYAGHCMAHKADAPYLNTPIEHYRAMATIFGTTAASGINARSGNDLLSIDVEDEENGEVNTSPNVAESSHPKGPPKKKAKVVKVLEDPLVTTLNYGFKLVADALLKSGDDDDIPAELWDEVCKLGEFDEEHLAHYYAHLVDNLKTAKAFMTLSQTNKSVWLSRYVKKNF
uniref:Myb/SANT-like domain-containing protein n=1 Tax=Hordeum vulgare subsp. vulgare TaxID=112509 RepID=A0A8I6YIR1_HORVV